VTLVDELVSGVPPVGAPDVAGAFGIGAGRAAGWILAAPAILAFFVEPPLLALAAKVRLRRYLVVASRPSRSPARSRRRGSSSP
jgi:hypothetical protein